MSEADLLTRVTGTDGRSAELRKATWDHVLAGHPEMADHLVDVIRTIESPEFREDDPRSGRIRYFRRCGPEQWIRVVIEFGGKTDSVVTRVPSGQRSR